MANRHELRVVGMSRSGNHAIINWILAQLPGKYCFLNCAEPKENPFETARPIVDDICFRANYDGFDLAAEQRGVFSQKDHLVYSYEDCFLGMACGDAFESRRESFVGPSERQTDIVILRDPFNLFASRRRASYVTAPLYTARRVWKQHAREIVTGGRCLKGERVFVRYNDWARDRTYRREIADALGIAFTDAGVESVSGCGEGSSFDGLRFNGRAGEMKVLERWKNFEDDPDFRAIFDEEMVALSEEIFGKIPGTDSLLVKTATVAA